MKHDAYIFDVDGVLIDTSTSFSEAVVLAVEIATGSSQFQYEQIKELKEILGFNNDWNVAIAGAAWISFMESTPYADFLDSLNQKGGGMDSLIKIIPSLSDSFQHNITQLGMEAYGGTSACKQLYGFEPETILIEGTWKNESVFIQANDLQSFLPKSGIITGRNETEMKLAFQILKWNLPTSRVAVSDNSQFDKPNPSKLKKIINELKSKAPIYFGDSRDDYDLVKNFKNETGIQIEFCCVGSQNGIQEFDYQVNNVMDYFKNMESNHG